MPVLLTNATVSVVDDRGVEDEHGWVQTNPDPATVWTGPASVQPTSALAYPALGEAASQGPQEPTQTSLVAVYLPADVAVEIGMRIDSPVGELRVALVETVLDPTALGLTVQRVGTTRSEQREAVTSGG